jgi:arylsulfatase A-like enzyme
MGAYGYDKPTTPFLDSVAKDAFVFLNAYTNAPWTRPAATSMLTGMWPSRHGTQTDRSRLPDHVPTVAEKMKALGYETVAVVGNGNAGSVAGLDRGFDHYVDTGRAWDGLPTAADVYAEANAWLASRKSDKPWFMFLFLIDAHDPYQAPPQYEKEWLGEYQGQPRRKAHWEFDNDYPEAERRSMIALYNASIRYTTSTRSPASL